MPPDERRTLYPIRGQVDVVLRLEPTKSESSIMMRHSGRMTLYNFLLFNHFSDILSLGISICVLCK